MARTSLPFPNNHRNIFTGCDVVTGLEQRNVLVKIPTNADLSKFTWNIVVPATRNAGMYSATGADRQQQWVVEKQKCKREAITALRDRSKGKIDDKVTAGRLPKAHRWDRPLTHHEAV
jgi:hypothetical protein